VRVTAGDLWRTLGRPTVPVGAVEARLLPVDALRVSLDGGPTTVAVAHVVAHRSWWRGPVAAVMNAQFVGDFDVAPRSHPNDGRADVLQTSTMPLRQRILARRRLKAGVHVPHPLIDERRVARADLRFVRPLYVWIDGVAAGEASTVTIEVVPDAFTVAV
jgi:diacylglycerol kinase family enzyme